jgi:hypothetical protein
LGLLGRAARRGQRPRGLRRGGGGWGPALNPFRLGTLLLGQVTRAGRAAAVLAVKGGGAREL